MDWDKISLVLTAVTAAGAFIAAIGAWKSAKETKKTSLGQILMQIMDAYSSDEMLEGIRSLSLYKERWERDGKDFAKIFAEQRIRHYHMVEETDKHRRKYSYHFHKISRLLDFGIVDENFVKNLLTYEDVEPLFQIIEPMLKAMNPNYDRRTFETFRNLYDKPK